MMHATGHMYPTGMGQGMEMDPEDIIWLSSNHIQTIYLKDNPVNKMYKFTVAQPQQEALKKLVFCFLKETKD